MLMTIRTGFLMLCLLLVGISIWPSASSDPSPQSVTLPKACNPNPTCTGSTCSLSITTASATVPVDACPRFGENQDDVDVYSWNTFIALNWPVNAATCEADLSHSILNGKGPVVWQSYADSGSIFVASGQQPMAWCKQDLTKPLDLRGNAKVSAAVAARFHGIFEAVGGPLTDQNGRFVRYQKLANSDEYNYLIDNTLWNAAGQKGQTISFPSGPNQNPGPCKGAPCGPVGAMEIKAAWKVLDAAEIKSGRFFMTEAIVYNNAEGAPSPGKNPVTVGLVGLHVIHKTQTQGSFFWSTFEHVDNTTKSFFNPNCKTCLPNLQTAAQPYTELTTMTPPPVPVNKPVQVVRVTPIQANGALNLYYRGLLKGTVWANYELISTQWATGGAPAGTPAILGNTTLETFIQKNSSCLGCHKMAQTAVQTNADFSFLLSEAQ
jgi:hypothetical protein